MKLVSTQVLLALLPNLSPEQWVKVSIDLLGEILKARVTAAAPTLPPSTRKSLHQHGACGCATHAAIALPSRNAPVMSGSSTGVRLFIRT